MPWSTSTRTLPTNWTTTRRRILNRDGNACQLVDDNGLCGRPANEVDHIGDRDTHTDDNLRALCTWHHARRSSQQGNAARQPITTRRPAEPHPGLHQ